MRWSDWFGTPTTLTVDAFEVGHPDGQLIPFWAQTLGVALNSEVVFVEGSAGPLLGPP
jgi:hypothetical protein